LAGNFSRRLRASEAPNLIYRWRKHEPNEDGGGRYGASAWVVLLYRGKGRSREKIDTAAFSNAAWLTYTSVRFGADEIARRTRVAGRRRTAPRLMTRPFKSTKRGKG